MSVNLTPAATSNITSSPRVGLEHAHLQIDQGHLPDVVQQDAIRVYT